MIDRNQQTVRQLRESVREWLLDVDEMIMIIGHDRWLDIPVQDFQRLGASDVDEMIAMLVMWDVLAPTMMQIAALPERDDGDRGMT